MQKQQRVATALAARGVYWALGTKSGKPMVFAIDSKGDEVKRLILEDDSWSRAERAIEALWQYLDSVDPIPHLVLVKPQQLPVTVQKPRPDTYDPYENPQMPAGPWRAPW